jgi:hypothetical protein
MDNQTKINQLIESARSWQNIAEWAVRIGILFFVVAFLCGAWGIHRKGLKMSKTKTLTGTPVTVIALLMVAAALAVPVIGIFVWPGLPR